MIDYLEWDSQFFGMKIGRYNINFLSSEILNELLKQKSIDHYQLVYLLAEQIADDALTMLNRMNLSPVDNKVTFGCNVTEKIVSPTEIVNYQGSLTPDLLQLALDSGHQSRFKLDPHLAPKYESLYHQWIQKSLSGEMADVVFVYQQDVIKGFVTVKKSGSCGKIGLIAVHNSMQTKGIGSLLLESVMHFCYENKLNTCEVVTQYYNIGACRLYEKNGFNIILKEIIYHL